MNNPPRTWRDVAKRECNCRMWLMDLIDRVEKLYPAIKTDPQAVRFLEYARGGKAHPRTGEYPEHLP